ncbi:transmembrane protein 5-like [Plakobranchus ocellatus]|uniref:Transmembrane protein 5-like n=1 Tax=Plakobranchus ocellatus TaxID=259542 RepID=A0AAV4D8L9_9GAST|nr:transmembrane protein 5-like [Plakobranchus ocellatus]
MLSFRKVAYCTLSVYLIITCYYGFHVLKKKLTYEGADKGSHSRPKSLADIVDDPDWNPWGEEFESEVQSVHFRLSPQLWQNEPSATNVDDAGGAINLPKVNYDHAMTARDLVTTKPKPRLPNGHEFSSGDPNVVEVWGKAAISLYLWQHILEADLEDKLNGIWQYGEKTIGTIKFRFRTGPGVVPSKVPRETENLLLVINGREATKIEAGKVWLDSLAAFPRLKNVAVVLLGREDCDNVWFYRYLQAQGGRVKALFLVYDSPEVDNVNIFQWPLGVATYRDFPVIQTSDPYSDKKRRYMYNFLGTIYQNSSREMLISAVKSSAQQDLGYVRARAQWQPQETPESSQQYLYALSNSDLTLSPVGINSECYRIFEAMALGSVPVIEDVMTPGYCGDRLHSQNTSQKFLNDDSRQNLKSLLKSGSNFFSSRTSSFNEKFSAVSSPLRLLKEFDAPVIYIKDWKTDLHQVLSKEALMSNKDRAARRRSLLKWYADFLAKMKNRLISVLQDKFFGKHNNL